MSMFILDSCGITDVSYNYMVGNDTYDFIIIAMAPGSLYVK